MKKLSSSLLLTLLTALTSLTSLSASAQAPQPVPISVIVREDCAHCQDEKAFLEDLKKTRQDIQVILHDIDTEEGKTLFDQLTEKEKLTKATPITLVGNTIIQGFDTAETTGKRIEELVNKSLGKNTLTLPEYLAAEISGTPIETIAEGSCDGEGETCTATYGLNDTFLTFSIPFFGTVNSGQFSLPVLASILGFIDGFNPCAMWVLVTFLIILIEIGDRRLMWRIAGLFIVAEAIMYYLILNVWFTTWDFIGLDRIVTPIVGIIAVAAGLYFLYEGIKSDGTCKVTNLQQKARLHRKIKEIAMSPFTFVTAIGVIGLALSVNIIEFACSIGIPQTFTKIIELNQLNWFESQGLMALYILFYMVDDFIVFGIALWGAQHLGLTSKYTKWSHLIGGTLMIILGALLIFSPESLRF
ncbi:MAG: glutaredoxin [Candidatus Altimarinota bacterium]